MDTLQADRSHTPKLTLPPRLWLMVWPCLSGPPVEHDKCGERIRSIELRLQQKDNEIRNVYEQSAVSVDA